MSFQFDHRLLSTLPTEAELVSHSRQVMGAVASRVAPTPVSSPKLLAHASEVADLLGFDAGLVNSADFLAAFSGNRLWPQMQAFASNYGGHQFGHWAGQLGDGRAISLGEGSNAAGQRFELQLKGAGPTPYSRGSDGRAVLRSSLREYLCSEAMHHLGVPTTRALCLIATGDLVVRDILYSGDPEPEPGAIVCRVAPSFLRFGHFELPAARGDIELLKRLIDFAIDRDFPEITATGEQRIGDWFLAIAERTAELLAQWMRVGFVHGVMNTDNMSILGITIDYGPYGWLEPFDPAWTPNTTDAAGKRYCYGRQPGIAHWNLLCFAQAIAPALQDHEVLQTGMQRFADCFSLRHRALCLAKLGLSRTDEVDPFLQQLFKLLQDSQLDFTRFFRDLPNGGSDTEFARRQIGNSYAPAAFDQALPDWQEWLSNYRQLLERESSTASERAERMNAVNPKYVFRNYLAQLAIDAATEGDVSVLEELHQVLRQPYAEQPEFERYAAMRPAWAENKPGCSMLSCSS